MRTRPLVLVALLAALSPVVLVGPAAPAAAATAGLVTTDGWTWEVLTDENDLFGEVTPPAIASVAGVDVDTTAPTLRAPSIPMLYTLISDARWTYGSVLIDQPVADGPAVITATLSGPGGAVDVTAELDGGAVQYTLEWSTPLTATVGVDIDPFADGYTDGELNAELVGGTIGDLSGWQAGSTTHHSAAWALDQLDGDPQPNWVVFVVSTDAPVDVTSPALAPAVTTTLNRLLAFGDGATGPDTPADTWIARVSLVGGAGCAASAAQLAELAATLTDALASGSVGAGTTCLSADPVAGAVGEPLDVVVPIELDPALASTAWWADRDTLELRIGDLPVGLTATLQITAGEPALRIQGTPESAGDVTVPIVLGGQSGVSSPELVDAVGGQIDLSIAPVLAATGPELPAPALVAGALALLMLGVGLVRVGAVGRARVG